ncbi:hypothetical protein HYT84_03720, partial [Candidatus Micrarchaeota archaeon]|nr:hypothetical protein [Candidatus Micrarchaeota archaeon]
MIITAAINTYVKDKIYSSSKVAPASEVIAASDKKQKEPFYFSERKIQLLKEQVGRAAYKERNFAKAREIIQEAINEGKIHRKILEEMISTLNKVEKGLTAAEKATSLASKILNFAGILNVAIPLKFTKEYTLEEILNAASTDKEQVTLDQLKDFNVEVGSYVGNALKLGEGATGVVYLLEIEGRKRVVKIATEKTPDLEVEKLLLTELKDSPNIVKLIAPVKDQDIIVIEYIPGKSLEVMITEGSVIEDSLVEEIQSRIQEALDKAHSLGIFHRDATPTNVMIEFDNQGHLRTAKLIDFGFSRKYKEETPEYAVGEYIDAQEFYFLTLDLTAMKSSINKNDKETLKTILAETLTKTFNQKEELLALLEQTSEETLQKELSHSKKFAKERIDDKTTAFIAKLRKIAEQNGISTEEFTTLIEEVDKRMAFKAKEKVAIYDQISELITYDEIERAQIALDKAILAEELNEKQIKELTDRIEEKKVSAVDALYTKIDSLVQIKQELLIQLQDSITAWRKIKSLISSKESDNLERDQRKVQELIAELKSLAIKKQF